MTDGAMGLSAADVAAVTRNNESARLTAGTGGTAELLL